MLKYRLIFGTLMTACLIGLILLDGWLDGSLSAQVPDKQVQGTILTILAVLLAVPAQLELARLIRQKGMHPFVEVTLPATILLAAAPFLNQLNNSDILAYLLFVPAGALIACFAMQAIRFGTEGTIGNVGASLLSVFYLGFLSMFIVAIRVEWGPWVLMFFVFTVKASDIGAYTVGKLFGKHKMTPRISPGKSWEGLGGAVLFGMIVSIGISTFCDIMSFWESAIFGGIFGVLGQMGDLMESMLKRDAAVKDSSAAVPGFGGLLDVIDSPLATAPAALAAFLLLL
ncbi:MAG: phosphatidate cytidylyltransferase [Planctomycetaceae bacterium]|nr:phosphatidate cytidylyltransferase [Planctomycetaceae bacterium]